MDDTERRAGLYVTTRGTRIGWLVSEVFFVAIASERGMPLTRPISWLSNERLYPRLLIKIGSEFVCSEFKSFVKRTNTSKSES